MTTTNRGKILAPAEGTGHASEPGIFLVHVRVESDTAKGFDLDGSEVHWNKMVKC